jgi:hypothetical protein
MTGLVRRDEHMRQASRRWRLEMSLVHDVCLLPGRGQRTESVPHLKAASTHDALIVSSEISRTKS